MNFYDYMQKQHFQYRRCARFFRISLRREVFEIVREAHVCPDCTASTTLTGTDFYCSRNCVNEKYKIKSERASRTARWRADCVERIRASQHRRVDELTRFKLSIIEG